MNRKRRRAADFTDSLNSFRCTVMSETDFYAGMLQSFSQDSLEASEKTQESASKDSLCSSKHSTILAGNSTSDTLTNDASTSAQASHFAIQSVPDLNKRIELFGNENAPLCYKSNIGSTQEYIEFNDNKENSDPQCSRESQVASNEITKPVELPSSSFHDALSCMDEKTLNCGLIDEDSKRDTNYNIQSERNNITSVPDSTVLIEKNTSIDNDCIAQFEKLRITDCTKERSEVDEDEYRFESLLHSFDNHLNEAKEVSHSQQILRRLSEKYADSPKNFTEKLITVIEESVVHKEDDMPDKSAIDLSRLTAEFRKMCKYIEDETVPEWPTLVMSVPGNMEETHSSPVCVNDTSRKNCPNRKSLHSTPVYISSIDRLKYCRRLYHKMQGNSFRSSTDNICNSLLNKYDNASFEDLEAQCKRLFPDEQRNTPLAKKTMSLPCLMNMSDIRFICEQQMASLNDSNDTDIRNRGNTGSGTCTPRDKCSCSPASNSQKLKHQWIQQFHPKEFKEVDSKLKDLECEDMSYLKQKSRKINLKSDATQMKAKKITNNYMTIDPDELERTILQSIAEKRKRCLDTAKLITETNADPEVLGTQKSNYMSPAFPGDKETGSLSTNETKFLNTLMSCKNYYKYLKKQKPFFDQLENSRSSETETALEKRDTDPVEQATMRQTISGGKKFADERKMYLSPNIQSHGIDKSPASRKEDKEIKGRIGKPKFFVTPARSPVKKSYLSPNVKSCNINKLPVAGKNDKGIKGKDGKPQYFFTPGKSPVTNNCKKKRLYFPDMHADEMKTIGDNILKSPHAEELYRLNYNTVISPVGMYIRGTDTPIVRNVRGKSSSPLPASLKKNGKASPAGILGYASPSININRVKEKFTSKYEVSPKFSSTPKLIVSHGCKGKEITPKQPDSQSTPKTHFPLPKVSYKMPLQVRTIRDEKSPKMGNRVKQLLQSAQSKVVVKHQGRINTVLRKKGTEISEDEEVLEIDYKPEDESIHIEGTANRTNSIH